MIRKRIYDIFVAALFFALLSFFFACNEITQNEDEPSPEKGRLSFSVSESGRMILPSNVSSDEIVRAELFYRATGAGAYSKLKTWNASQDSGNAVSLMCADKEIEISVGTFDFKLNLYILSETDSNSAGFRLVQSGSISSKKIETGQNQLAFETKYVESGDLSLTLKWSPSSGQENQIGKIEALLYEATSQGAIGERLDFAVNSTLPEAGRSENENIFYFTKLTSSEVPNGTYFIKFILYDTDLERVINVILDSVKIHGYKSEKVISLDTKKLNVTENKKLYVSGTGNDEAYTVDNEEIEPDGSEENPFESIDKACEKIVETGSPFTNWTIFIMGDVTGPHEGTNKAGSRTYSKDYGMSSIPATITSAYAKSILVTGYNGLDENGLPQDMINRGLNKQNSLTGSSNDGTVLVITTEVPVTIMNLMLKNACNKNSNGSDLESAKKGGGLYVGADSTVSLANGVVITDNGAYYGGGVYNLGTVYMYGSAAIGNKTQTDSVYSNPANTAEDGGGIYNGGKLYLGYSSYVSESDNIPAEWTGFIQYNYSWRGGAIKNVETGTMIMNSGTLAYNEAANNSNAYGAAIYNLGSFLMTGGTIEQNRTEGSNGGGVYNAYSNATTFGTFTFIGGVIKNNRAVAGYGVDGDGGGVYNNGIMYVYGDAVIGDDSMESIATGSDVSETCSNLAAGQGGGIYVASNGKLYMGYSAYTSETENTPAEWKGGIFYNYAQSGGGGLGFAYGSSVLIHMNSGTIANNGAEKNGGAVYIGGDGFKISGMATIPAGDGEVKQSIYYNSTYSLNIADSLSSIKNGELYIIPSANDTKTAYSAYQPVIKLTDAATEAGLTIADVKDKFVIEPLTATATEIVTQWIINSSTGKVEQNASTFYVSASGLDSNDGLTASKALPSITSAVSKMNDATVDYTIYLSGEIFGKQVIADSEGSPVLANSITITGKSSTARTIVPKDILNANLGESETGSALTVDTKVPVTLYDIAVKGGRGTEKDGTIIGGGLLIGEGGVVSIEENTRILQNTITSGYGAGVYISKDAKLFVNSSSHITENTGATSGGGVYVADGGYLRTQQGSGSYITLNEAVNGGGVYLEDGSVYEMFGCYIRVNSVTENGLGSGVYVSANASFKMSGAAEVTIPNDVYLPDGAVVEIIDSVSASLSARLTPEKYPVEGGEDVCLIKRTLVTSSYNQTWESISGRFEITSQKDADGAGNTQYWYIDKSTDEGANGKLVKQTGMGLTVEIPIGITNDDIEVVVTSDGVPVSADTKIPVSSNLVFTATEGMASYTWTLDGEEVNKDSPAAHIYSPDTSSWIKGSYVVYLEARDSAGKYYSYTAQITVSE